MEFHHVGDYVKVSAIDPVTNTEACIVGSPKATNHELTQLAIRKLEFVLRKNRKKGDGGGTGGGIEV